jgi:GAF domain-containing protein
LPVAHKLDLPIEIASRYPLNAFEKEQNTLFTNQTVVIKDIATDLRLDRITKKLFQDVFQSRSSVIVPLMLADQSLGFVMGNYGESVEFTSAEIQRLSAIAGQVAITIQGLQLLKQTQERARREQLLREVTEQINNAVSTDMVLYRAAQELGRVLKQQVFVYLGEGRTSVDGNPPQSGIVK